MALERGGRKPKNTKEQLDKTVKTTVTEADLNRLQTDFKQETHGQKLSFAEYIRKRLLTNGKTEVNGFNRADILTIQIELAQISEQLKQWATTKSVTKPTQSIVKSDADPRREVQNVIGESVENPLMIERIDAAITQISTWLYGSSPEKI